jgi:hypothetical protein
MTTEQKKYPTIEVSKARQQIQEVLLENYDLNKLKVGSLILLGDKTYRIIEDKDQS